MTNYILLDIITNNKVFRCLIESIGVSITKILMFLWHLMVFQAYSHNDDDDGNADNSSSSYNNIYII